MSDPAPGSGNERITLALVRQDIQHLAARIEEMRLEQRRSNEDHESRLRTIEGYAAASGSRWQQHDREHDSLDSQVKRGDRLNTLATTVAAAVAALIGIEIKR